MSSRRRNQALALCLLLGTADIAYLNLLIAPVLLADTDHDTPLVATPRLDVPSQSEVRIQSYSQDHTASRLALPSAADAPPDNHHDDITQTTPLNGRAVRVYFNQGRSMLTSRSRSVLNRIVNMCRKDRKVSLTIEGHADFRGPDVFNDHLSKRRARRVARYLRDRGVSPSRMTVQAFGDDRPAQLGRSSSALRANRRVVVRPSGSRP